ncbi:MAG: hypothetical protein AAFR87_32900, partial [Bacteroidota bacterium]
LDDYISRTRDVGDFLGDNKKRIFRGKAAYDLMLQRFNNYTEAYESLNRNRDQLIQRTGSNWRDQTNKFETRVLLNKILDDFHKQQLLPARKLLGDIYDRLSGPLIGRRSKKEILNDIEHLIDQIENGLNSIEREKSRVIEALSNN